MYKWDVNAINKTTVPFLPVSEVLTKIPAVVYNAQHH